MGFTNHNVVQATVYSPLGLEQASGQQTLLGGGNGRAEELSWLLGSRRVAGTIFIQYVLGRRQAVSVKL